MVVERWEVGMKLPWWRTARSTATRSYVRARATGSTPSEFWSFRSANVAEDTSTETFSCQQAGMLGILSKLYLRIPIRDMLVTLPISLLTQRSNDISEGTQTLVDVLRLL